MGLTTRNIPANTNVILPVLKNSEITFNEHYPAGENHAYKVSGPMPALELYGIDCGGATGWHMGVDSPSCSLFFPSAWNGKNGKSNNVNMLKGNFSANNFKVRKGASERHGRNSFNNLVGTARFELATPCTPCMYATRLRYAPTRS